MCGICFVCSSSNTKSNGLNDVVSDEIRQDFPFRDGLLQNRGPDASLCSQISLPKSLNAFMQGCVLHLRGNLTLQPITSAKGNALLWNGEIFDGIEVSEEENDTQILFNLLDSCCDQKSVLQVFQKIQGPWAFIFWQATTETLWFGRDMFGRRSLLWHIPEVPADDFILSSVVLGDKVYKEIPSVGIFRMNFSEPEEQRDTTCPGASPLPNVILHPWLECRWPGTDKLVQSTPADDLEEHLYPNRQNCTVQFIVSELSLNCWIPSMCRGFSELDLEGAKHTITQNKSSDLDGEEVTSFSKNFNEQLEVCLEEKGDKNAVVNLEKQPQELLWHILEEKVDNMHFLIEKCICTLQEAVKKRVKNLTRAKDLPKNDSGSKQCLESTARVALLFSGGLDSTLLAALVDRCLPEEEPIDLLNVAFEQAPPPIDKKQHGGKRRKPDRQNRKVNCAAVTHGQGCGSSDLGSEGLTHSDDLDRPHANARYRSFSEENHISGSHSLAAEENCLSVAPTVPLQLKTLANKTLESCTKGIQNSNRKGTNPYTPDSNKLPSVDLTVSRKQSPSLYFTAGSIPSHTVGLGFSSPVHQDTSCSALQPDQSSPVNFAPGATNDPRIQTLLNPSCKSDLPERVLKNLSSVPQAEQSSVVDFVSGTTNDSHIQASLNQCSKSSSSDGKLKNPKDSASCPVLSLFDPYNVPDRQTGKKALSELNPRRQWNFVEINVTQQELLSVRQSHISRLIYPLRTVLDDSIGCAVWFAARGQGVVDSGIVGQHEKQVFSSRAQILLCGMAADELFAGYSRHRATFTKDGWAGLEREMEQELWRISARNLGRDDRIITDHGKEARFPYLDEKFVQLVSEIPLQKRIDFNYPRGIGEKLLLRLCALKLGLTETACQAKRAIQFGSKIAKLDNKKEKGSDVCDRLL